MRTLVLLSKAQVELSSCLRIRHADGDESNLSSAFFEVDIDAVTFLATEELPDTDQEMCH